MNLLNYVGYIGTFAAGLLVGAYFNVAVNAWRKHAAVVAANQEAKLQAAVKAEIERLRQANNPQPPAAGPTA